MGDIGKRKAHGADICKELYEKAVLECEREADRIREMLKGRFREFASISERHRLPKEEFRIRSDVPYKNFFGKEKITTYYSHALGWRFCHGFSCCLIVLEGGRLLLHENGPGQERHVTDQDKALRSMEKLLGIGVVYVGVPRCSCTFGEAADALRHCCERALSTGKALGYMDILDIRRRMAKGRGHG